MEAAVGNETDGRRKEIADKILALAEKSELFCILVNFKLINKKAHVCVLKSVEAETS